MGAGIVDWNDFSAAAKVGGLKYIFVEMESNPAIMAGQTRFVKRQLPPGTKDLVTRQGADQLRLKLESLVQERQAFVLQVSRIRTDGNRPRAWAGSVRGNAHKLATGPPSCHTPAW